MQHTTGYANLSRGLITLNVFTMNSLSMHNYFTLTRLSNFVRLTIVVNYYNIALRDNAGMTINVIPAKAGIQF